MGRFYPRTKPADEITSNQPGEFYPKGNLTQRKDSSHKIWTSGTDIPNLDADYHPHQTIAANSELLRELTCIDFQIEPCFSQPRGARIRGGAPHPGPPAEHSAYSGQPFQRKKKDRMKFQIHHPRLLILALLTVSILATVGVIVADWDRPVLETQSYSLPVQSFADPPTDAEVADAMQITRDAGWVSAVAGEQEWSLIDRNWDGGPRWISIPGSNQHGIRFTAVWDNPIDSDGPWYRTRCQVTRLIEGHTSFNNIHAVKVIVDMDGRVPLVRSVTAPFRGEKESWNPEFLGIPPAKNTQVVKNMGTREELYRGSYDDMPGQFKNCPSDAEDYKD